MGYGFVEFTNHNNALAALRANNNNPDIFGADRRPIVEFSLENSLVVKVKQRWLDKARQRQQPKSEQAKANKEIGKESETERKKAAKERSEQGKEIRRGKGKQRREI